MKEPTPEQLDKLAEKLIAMVNEAVAGKARELSEIIEADGFLDRCGICYWPLAKSGETGCVRGRCSMVGEDSFAPQRRIHRENIEKRLEWLEPWVIEVYLNAIMSILKEVSVSTKSVPAENKIGEK